MERFVQRVISHLGATQRPGQEASLRSFASGYVGRSGASFQTMMEELGSQPSPSWLEFDPEARCMASRDVTPGAIGVAIGWVCANAPSLNCSLIPEDCESDPYRVGDYVFSRYYNRHGDTSNPLLGCSFQGAAVFASSRNFEAWTGASLCSEEPPTTTTTSIGTVTTSTATTTTT